MFHPAHAMGIDAGPSWCDEEEHAWQERAAYHSTKESWPHEDGRGSPVMSAGVVTAQWIMSPTPELEAFTSSEAGYEPRSDVSEGASALGITLEAATMERKASNESVFEDDEPVPNKRRPGPTINTAGGNMTSNSSLSRFFSWKRTNKGKPATTLPPAPWEVPHSAPPQIETFDLLSLGPPAAFQGAGGACSLPNTPVDGYMVLPPSKKAVARKSSMPSLRDIRRATTSPLAKDVPLPDVATAVAPFYWRSNETPTTPVLAPCTPTLPSTPSDLAGGGRATPRMASRISSVGRGAARKSTVDILMPVVAIKSPKKKKRFDPWRSPDMPPLPLHSSFSQTAVGEEQHSRGAPFTAARQTRRRSRSVGAPPTLSMFGTPPLPSPVLESEEAVEDVGAEQDQVRRVKRGIIGRSSPKLFVRASPMMGTTAMAKGRNRDGPQIDASQAPAVVVNVMPPTPDLGAEAHETFEGRNASPGVRRSLNEAQMSSLVEGHEYLSKEHDNVLELDKEDDSFLPYATGQSFGAVHRRSQSTVSDLSDFSTSTVSEDTDGVDEPFGFTRSLSSTSLSSEESSDSDLSEEEGLQSATIMSASSAVSSYGRAQLVSPRSCDFACWSSSGSSTSSGLASTSESDSLTSFANRRNSKRFSGLPSLSSGQSLASVMTTSTSILDFGSDSAHVCAFKKSSKGGDFSDLSSPVELQGQMDEGDCDTPRLSGGCNATMASVTHTTQPLMVRKHSSPATKDAGVLSPISPRPYPRAHNATSPHLELDLSLPLDLHEIGLGFELNDPPKKREKPKVPQKSRARNSTAAGVGEPKTPPNSNRLLSSVMQDEWRRESFGLGLGLGLDSALQLGDRRAHQSNAMMSSNGSPSLVGFAL